MEEQVGFRKVGDEMLMDDQDRDAQLEIQLCTPAKGGRVGGGCSACASEWYSGKSKKRSGVKPEVGTLESQEGNPYSTERLIYFMPLLQNGACMGAGRHTRASWKSMTSTLSPSSPNHTDGLEKQVKKEILNSLTLTRRLGSTAPLDVLSRYCVLSPWLLPLGVWILSVIESSVCYTFKTKVLVFSWFSAIRSWVISLHCLLRGTAVLLDFHSTHGVHDPWTPSVTGFHWAPWQINLFAKHSSVLNDISISGKETTGFFFLLFLLLLFYSATELLSIFTVQQRSNNCFISDIGV